MYFHVVRTDGTLTIPAAISTNQLFLFLQALIVRVMTRARSFSLYSKLRPFITLGISLRC